MKKTAWGFVVLGTIFMCIGVWLVSQAKSSAQWPIVLGTISETRVVGRINLASDVLRRYIDYAVEVEYSYLVAGQFYLSDRFSLGSGSTVEGGFDTKKAARVWLKNSPYQVKENIKVYVDPKDPTNTVLDAGIHATTWIPIGLALCCGSLAWLLFRLDNRLINTKLIQPPK